MDMHELEKLSEQDLQAKLAELRESVEQLRFQAATGQLKQIDQIKKHRTDIARIMTVLNAKKKQSLNN